MVLFACRSFSTLHRVVKHSHCTAAAVLCLQRVYNREAPFKMQLLPFSLMTVIALASIGGLAAAG
jgi:hypothetical protein